MEDAEKIRVFHSTWVFHKSQYHSTIVRSSEVNFITLTFVQNIEMDKKFFQ